MIEQNTINENDIAIIGIGCRFPGNSNSPKEFWDNLSSKNFDGIVDITEERWSKSFYQQGMLSNSKSGLIDMKHWKNFDSLFFGISSKDSLTTDPQQRLLYTVLWEALEDAHIKPSEIRGSETSVFIGSMNQDYTRINEKKSGLMGSSIAFLSNAMSFTFDLRGPSMTLDTACSSSLNAIHLGCQSILSGQCEYSVCGGVNALLDPDTSITYSQLGILGKSGVSRPFDADADGYIRGEGVGLVILKSLSKAIKDGDRIYCVIKGSRSNSDGQNQKNYPTTPSGQAQYENIEAAFKEIQIPKSDIFYFEAHGTSTAVGDPTEIEALSRIFKEYHSPSNPLYIGSIKSNIGHTESASGIASLIKIAMMMKHRKLAPNINFNKPNPKIDFEGWNMKVVTELIDFPQDQTITMGLNSFGFGGSNCFMLLQEFKSNNDEIQYPSARNHQEKKEYIIPFSSHLQISFDKYIDEVIKRSPNTEESFQNFVKYQCLSKDLSLSNRFTLSCRDWNDLKSKRNLISSSQQSISNNDIPSIVFVFCGQGPQWKGMLDYLYQSNQIFRESVQHCDKMMSEYFGYSILEKLQSISNVSDLIHHPIIAQPSLFLFQYGMIEFLKGWGINPDAVIGHSFGEVSSALCSGIISLSSAIKIVFYRSTSQQLTVGSGRMLSINVGLDKFNEIIQQSEQLQSLKDGDIEIACFNSPNSIVLTSSSEDSLILIQNHLNKMEIFNSFLGTPCSFHSSKQETIKDRIIQSLSDLPPSRSPTIPFFSTVTGQQMTGGSFYNNEFIYDNLRKPVKFNESIQELHQYLEEKNKTNKSTIFIEISPHPTLSFYIPQCINNINNNKNQHKITTLSLINKKKSIPEQIQQSLSQLFFNGYKLNFQCAQFENDLSTTEFKHRTDWIPKYQFEQQEYWSANAILREELIPSTSLLGKNKSQGIIRLETLIDLKKPAFQFLKGHVIKGKFIFPGCGYLDILLKQYPKQDLTIYNLEIEKPCLISNEVPVLLQTIIQPTMTRNEFKIEFYYKYTNSSENKWIKTCHGRYGVYPLDYSTTQFDIEKLKQECSYSKLNKTEVYNRLAQLGIPYGPSFQKIFEMNMSSESTFSILDATNNDDSFYFNASTLDSSCHGISSGLEPPQEIVFSSIQKLNYYPSNMTSKQPTILYAYGKEKGYSANESCGSVDIINPDNGRSIIHMIVTMTSITRIKFKNANGIYNIKYPAKETYTYHWQPKESILLGHQLNMSMLNSSQKHLIKVLIFNNYVDDSKNNHQMKLNSIIDILKLQIKDNTLIKIDITVLNYSTNNASTLLNDYQTDRISIRHRAIQNTIEFFDPEKEYIPSSNYDMVIFPLEVLKPTNGGGDQIESNSNSIFQHIHSLLIPKGCLIIVFQEEEEDNSTLNFKLSQIGFNNINQQQQSTTAATIQLYQKESKSSTKEDLKNILICPITSDNQKLSGDIEKIFINQNYQIIGTDEYLLNPSSYESDRIFFIGISMNKDNYLKISMDLIRIAQYYYKNPSKSKFILLTVHDDKNRSNYLNGSLIGCFRYLLKEDNLDIYSINIDQESLLKSMEYYMISSILSPSTMGYDREFNIRNGKTLVQRLHSDQLKSNSYENDFNNLYMKCNSKLELVFKQKQELLPNQYEIKSMASGINYKDLMFYKGLLPLDMYPIGTDMYNPSIGLECAGIVTRVGPGSNNKYKVGDRILCFSTNSIATHVYTIETNMSRIPDNISFIEAASLGVTYITAYFSLISLVNIEEFDSILIHSASGGVGLSVLNILKWKKFKGKILVSVGSKLKEQYLRDHYGHMITDYFNSRTHSYSEEILEKYGGVDIILNTLSGDFMSSNFKCLTKVGRIVDLSVSQLIDNELMDLGQLKYSRAFISFELWAYNLAKPGQFARVLDILLDNVSKGNLDLIPIKSFKNNQIKEAIEHIGESKHLGKLVVDFETEQQIVPVPSMLNHKVLKNQYELTSLKETLIITGQSGIVIPVLKWILQRSSNLKNIIILSKSKEKWEIEWIKNNSKNIHLIFKQCDVSDKYEIKRNIEQIQKEHPTTLSPIQIKSIVHLATIYEILDLHDIDEKSFAATHLPKAIGAINLHELSIELQWELDNFILFSSVAAFFGGSKQCHYVSANHVLDHLAEFRRSNGLAATSINFGALEGGGVVANNKIIEEFLESEGLNLISLPKILGGLDIALDPANQFYSCFQLSSNNFVKMYCNGDCIKAKIEHLISKPDQIYQFHNKNSNTSNIHIQDSVQEKLIQMVSKLLAIETSNFNPDIKLKDYGIDSLMTTQLKTSIEEEFEPTINQFTHIMLISNSTNTISEKISFILNK